MAKLRAISGPLAGQTIEVENELVIGRQESDVTIDDLELSRHHAVVRHHANRLQVEDLGSSNGTFVDGTRIEEPTLLGGGAEIRLGATVLVVEGVLPVQSTEAIERSGVDTIAPGLARQETRIHSAPPPPPNQGAAMPGAVASNSASATASAPPSSPPAAPSPPSPAAPASGPTPSAPLGEFRPPQRSHHGGIATRSWVAVALSFGTAIAVAIALIIFFATSG
jgi:pSer/pThr/pTyr-binding forkhead associated (FHA) protein